MKLQAFSLGLVTLFAASLAQAATINIQLLDTDVIYSGSVNTLYDAAALAGGNNNPAEADEVEAINFELDGTQVATLMSTDADPLWGDLSVANLDSSLMQNVFLEDIGDAGGGFGFDFFGAGFGLELGIGSIDAFVSPAVFFFTAPATVLSQNLPAGLEFDPSQPVQISYTATLPAVQLGSTTSMIAASGVMTISGTQIPEPSSALLLATLAGVALLRRR